MKRKPKSTSYSYGKMSLPPLVKGTKIKFKKCPYRLVLYLNVGGYHYKLSKIIDEYYLTIFGGRTKKLKKPIRHPRSIIRKKEFDPIFYEAKKPKEKHPELFKELEALRNKFLRLNRRISIHCPLEESRYLKALEYCFTRCKRTCAILCTSSIAGPEDYENRQDLFNDLLKMQRLCGLIWGTVRDEDHFDIEENE